MDGSSAPPGPGPASDGGFGRTPPVIPDTPAGPLVTPAASALEPDAAVAAAASGSAGQRCAGYAVDAVDTADPGPAAGSGHLAFRRVAGRTAVTRCAAVAPLKLLTPRRRGPAAWAYLGTFGGGLVAGDHVHLYADVHENATAVLASQAPGKVFRRCGAEHATQTLRAGVAGGGLLVVAPDALTLFEDAHYVQEQTFELAADASLVLLDWVHGGRVARGERWTLHRYDSLNRVSVGGTEKAFDRTRLDADAPAAGPFAAGPYDVLATLFFVGPRAAAGLDAAAAWTQTLGPPGAGPLQAAVSRRPWGGVLRLAGERPAAVAATLRERLAFLEPELGAEVWSRRS